MIKKILRQLLKVFWIIPIRKNRIVFRSTHGLKYNCNPKYICEYLQKNYPDEYELVWLFDKKALSSHAYLANNGIKVCNQKSLIGLFNVINAKIIIDNHGLMSYIPIRKNQVVINTWHGSGSYKKEYVNSTKEHKDYMHMMYETTTAFISSCERFSKCNLSQVYKTNIDKILEIGTPRNDIFFGNKDDIKNKVKKELGIADDKKIVLYAPTFRYDLSLEAYRLDTDTICKACEERFGGSFVFATRLHPFVENAYQEVGENVVKTNLYEDMQELLLAIDVLITDYSSCMWDASLAYKPCFIFAADLDNYMKMRNFYTPIEEWPFALAETEDKLIDNILSFNSEFYTKEVDRHHKELGSFEKGNACKAVAEYIYEKTR